MGIVFYTFQSEYGRQYDFASVSHLDESSIREHEEKFKCELKESDKIVTLTTRTNCDPIIYITRNRTERYTRRKSGLDVQDGVGFRVCLAISDDEVFFSKEPMKEAEVEQIVKKFISMKAQSVIRLSKGMLATNHFTNM